MGSVDTWDQLGSAALSVITYMAALEMCSQKLMDSSNRTLSGTAGAAHLKVFDALSAGDGEHIGTLGMHPCKGELAGSAPLLACQILHAVHHAHVGLKRLLLPPWHVSSPVIWPALATEHQHRLHSLFS